MTASADMSRDDPSRPLAVVVLAAGKGTRMRSDLPKVLHKLAHRSMVGHVLAAVAALRPDRTVVVVGPGMEQVTAHVAPADTAVQVHQQGTGDAVRATGDLLRGFRGDVLVVYGDTPLVTTATLARIVTALRSSQGVAVALLGMRPADPGRYGRLVLGTDGGLERIVEYLDATADQRAIDLCNGGIMAFDGTRMWDILDRIGCDNAKGEYYLTDAVAIARSLGHRCLVVEGPETEALGVNSRAELAAAEQVLQQRLRQGAMDAGVTLVAPETIFLASDTQLGRDVVVHPHVVFGPGVIVSDDVEILSFSHLEGVSIASGARVGPFARLRPGSIVGRGAHVGNFVELKAAELGDRAKVNHLSYIGDASIGAATNVGAGTITCNYDGVAKHRTRIGAGAFIGSNTALVAPVAIGDGAIVGAGSTVTADVPPDALALARARLVLKPGWAAALRARRGAKPKG